MQALGGRSRALPPFSGWTSGKADPNVHNNVIEQGRRPPQADDSASARLGPRGTRHSLSVYARCLALEVDEQLGGGLRPLSSRGGAQKLASLISVSFSVVLPVASERLLWRMKVRQTCAGANLKTKTATGCTGLYLASRHNHVRVAQVLIDGGANVHVHARDELGVQSIHGPAFAATGDSAAILGLLLQHGAAVDSLDRAGGSPLNYALGRGTLGAVRFLLENGANPNPRFGDGRPAVFHAIYAAEHAKVDLLLHYGADFTVVWGAPMRCTSSPVPVEST